MDEEENNFLVANCENTQNFNTNKYCLMQNCASTSEINENNDNNLEKSSSLENSMVLNLNDANNNINDGANKDKIVENECLSDSNSVISSDASDVEKVEKEKVSVHMCKDRLV